jgi:hypothetical protein
MPRAIAGAQDAPERSVSPTEPEQYRQLVEEAVREFAGHHYAESRALFLRAHALSPSARTHRGIALAEFELRDYDECVRNLEAALESKVKPLTPELRLDTQRMLERANAFVGRVQVESKPKAEQILLDGAPIDIRADATLLLEVGDHTLEFRAAGFAPELRRIAVHGGDDRRLTVILAPKVSDKPVGEQRAWYRNPWLWAGVGVVVAGAAVGTGIALTLDEPQFDDGNANVRLRAP